MDPRFFVDTAFTGGSTLALPTAAARHVQVLRLQPGDAVALFNGREDSEWPAEIVRMGKGSVEVRLGAPRPVQRELNVAVTLAFGVPANDRMDALLEKCGELGAAEVQPLLCERSIVRLAGERAEQKRVHWQAVAAAASEQCGRVRLAAVAPVRPLAAWLAEPAADGARRFVLSFAADAAAPEAALGDLLRPAAAAAASAFGARRPSVVVLSGPEGGLSADEEAAAVAAGFERLSLGARVLRADTAPLALLAWLGLQTAGRSP